MACGIFVPRTVTEPAPLALEAWSLNHWTIREVPAEILKMKGSYGPCTGILWRYGFGFKPPQ